MNPKIVVVSFKIRTDAKVKELRDKKKWGHWGVLSGIEMTVFEIIEDPEVKIVGER
ncbi:MAG: hypothetical protein ABIG95_02670 [Candidatus Woesearchaeota archaeon]